MGRLIAVTSGKGGVGKSSVSVQLASSLTDMGHTVLLVDLDAGMRCLDLMLNLSNELIFDLNDVLNGVTSVEEAVLTDPKRKGLSFLAAPLKEKINADKLRAFATKATEQYDFVILDFPAGAVDELYQKLPRYTEALVVCNADAVSLRDASYVANDLKKLRLLSIRLVINRVSFENIRKGITANIDEAIDSCGIRLIGVIPQSMDLYLSGCSGDLLNKKSKTAKAFNRLAKRLLGYDIPLEPLKKM